MRQLLWQWTVCLCNTISVQRVASKAAPCRCREHVGAGRALGGLQMEERPEAADLVFKG